MRAKAARFLSMVLLAVSSLPFVAFAQPPLTQTYTSADGMITMSFPDGWTVSEDDGVINFFDGVSSFMEVGVNDYGDDVTMQEILEIGASVTYGFTEPESIVVGGWPALRAIDTGAFDQHHTLVNFCDGNMALIIGFGNVAVTGPTFEAMTDTLVYGGGEPQLCRGAFEGHAPITASNAASIAPLTTLGDADVTVMAVAFSPDGKLLAAAGDNRSVRLWSVLTGEEEVGLRGQAGDVSSLSFDNGTYQLVLGSGDGRVRLWNLDGGTSLSQYQSHDAPVLSVARQPDGFLVVSGAADGSVRVYDMLRGDEREPLVEAGGSPVTSVAFSPDEMRLAAGGGSMIQVWEAETGLLLSQVETPLTAITGLSFSPDGAQIVFAGDGDVWTWDVAGNPVPLAEELAVPVTMLAVHPNGTLIAAAGESTVLLLDATTGASLATLDLSASGVVHSIAFSADGALLAVGADTGGVQLFNATAAAAEPETAAETTTSTTGTTTTTAATCIISAPNNANLRSGPGTNFDRAGSLAAGQSAEVDGQAAGSDGMTWFRLTDGTWARSDVVSAAAECASVPAVEG